MIKKINQFLNKHELKLLQQYWVLREDFLTPTKATNCVGSFESYADTLSETLLVNKKYLIEEIIKEPLLPACAFSRLYPHKVALGRHCDRPACEVSVSLNIFADKDWSLWFVPINNKNKKPQGEITKPGDAILYEGCAYEHWRNPYRGKKCMQIFLHYVRAKGNHTIHAKDGRHKLGQDGMILTTNVWDS